MIDEKTLVRSMYYDVIFKIHDIMKNSAGPTGEILKEFNDSVVGVVNSALNCEIDLLLKYLKSLGGFASAYRSSELSLTYDFDKSAKNFRELSNVIKNFSKLVSDYITEKCKTAKRPRPKNIEEFERKLVEEVINPIYKVNRYLPRTAAYRYHVLLVELHYLIDELKKSAINCNMGEMVDKMIKIGEISSAYDGAEVADGDLTNLNEAYDRIRGVENALAKIREIVGNYVHENCKITKRPERITYKSIPLFES
jgi:hypothetical protein